MKRLLLGFLLFCPALTFAEGGFGAKCKALNDHRITSGVKALGQAALGGYAAYLGYGEFCGAFTDFKHSGFTKKLWDLKDSSDRWQQSKDAIKFGARSVILGYAAYKLLQNAWKNAKHAVGA